jgi:large subunit ribosomal protein L25
MGAAYELTATAREKTGKGAARAARRGGQIPAVIYGGKEPPLAVSLDEREIRARITGGGFYTTLATIAVDGKKISTLPREFQLDPVSDKPVHVDFLRVEPGSEIAVEVPVQFVNEALAPGIKRGGVLNVVRHRIPLYCKVESIPEKVVADITGLDIGDSLHISKITLPAGTRPTITRDFTVATVAASAGVKEEMKAAAEAAAAAKAAALAAAEAGLEEGAEGAVPAEGAAPAAPGAEGKPAAPGAKPAAAGAKPEAGKADAAKGKTEAAPAKGKPEAGKKG